MTRPICISSLNLEETFTLDLDLRTAKTVKNKQPSIIGLEFHFLPIHQWGLGISTNLSV